MSLQNPLHEPAELDAATLNAIGQFLALARAANVTFDLVDGRLSMHASHLRWKLWPAVRDCLDGIGIEAIETYFHQTTPEEREALSAAAPDVSAAAA